MEKKNKKTTTKKTKAEYKKGKAGVAAREAAAKKTVTRKTTKKVEEPVEEKEVKKVAAKKTEEVKETAKKTTKKETATEEKKETVKKETVKKTPAKKEEEKPKKVVKKEEEETEDIDFLEKTIIFDGKDRDNLRNVVDKLEEETIVTKNRIVRRRPINKMIIYVLIALIVITILGTTIYVVNDALKQKTDSETLNSNIYRKVSKNYKDRDVKVEEYQQTEQYAHFRTITLTKFEKKILDREDMLILISSQNCMGCLLFEPELEKELADKNKTIYRLDITDWTEEERGRLRTYYHFSSTPTLFKVEKGIVTKDSASVPEDIQKLIDWTMDNL
ncbi:MAG: hypothetical protein IKQ29_03405 [Bacilli bacterium]|nr:hypothetical protein [Bacilli bacterium]